MYQYGGQFSDSPPVSPPESNVFAYDIGGGEWSIVETGGDTVGRTAEGSWTFVEGLGQGGENTGFCKYKKPSLSEHKRGLELIMMVFVSKSLCDRFLGSSRFPRELSKKLQYCPHTKLNWENR